MRLNLWEHPTQPAAKRLYLNGLKCLEKGMKAYLMPVRGRGLKLNVSDEPIRQAVMDELMSVGFIAPGGLSNMTFKQASEWAIGGANEPSSAKPTSKTLQASNLDLSSIKVPDPVTIRIDHREPKGLVELLSDLDNVVVESDKALPIGDIEINGRYVIERKRCTESDSPSDFELSVKNDDKRLFFQSEKLKNEDDIVPIVLLEGNVHKNSPGMLVQAVDGMLSFLITVQRMSVITSYSLHHTAYIILKLATHDRSGLGYEVALRGKKPRQPEDQMAFVLEGLPGVSAGMARDMAKRFPSLLALASASDEELLAVKSMGPGRLSKIRHLLSDG
jgi:ERCC4-type nuclease